MTLQALQARIGEWHVQAFDWAGPTDCLIKLQEETLEALAVAEGVGDEPGMLQDELADCLICILAAAARAGIDLEDAVAGKLPRVIAKHPASS